MKFLHLGDLHIGKLLYEFDLIEDQRYIFDQIIEIAVDKKVDGILIAGDVYDKTIPSENAVRLFDYFLCQLEAKKLKTFIISGNHDSDERLNFGSSLFESKGVYISSKFNGKLYKREFEDQSGKVNVYLLPYVKGSQVKHFYPDEKIENYNDAVKAIIKRANINTDERNILVAHQFVGGKEKLPNLAGSEGVAVKNVGTVEIISSECFDDFDYVALGHIHSGQSVGREEVRYSGSPLKYSLSEIDDDKSVPIITLGQKGKVDIEFAELKPLRNLRHIKGKLNVVLDDNNISDEDDYIYMTLTDEDFVNDAIGIVRQYYKNTVKLNFENSYTQENGQIEIKDVAENKPFNEVISDFYHQVYGCDINEEELGIMLEIAREVGVVNETN